MNARRYTPPFSTSGIVAVAAAVLLVAVGVQQFWTRNPTPGDKIVALLWILLAVVILAVIGLVLGGGVAGVVKMWNKATTVQPDERGALPVHARTIRTTDVALRSLNAMQRTELARASRAIPDGVHTVTSAIPNTATLELVEDAEIVEAQRVVPTFSDLVRSHKVGPGQPLVIGYDGDGELVVGSWEDFYSMGVGGIPGSGKSNTAVHFIAQVLAADGEVYLWDPNKGNRQSLANRLGPMADLLADAIAKSHEEGLALVRKFHGDLQERKRIDDERDRLGQPEIEWPPSLLVVDEFTIVMKKEQSRLSVLESKDRKTEEVRGLQGLLGDVNLEGRKYGKYALYLGQIWSAAATGGGDMRDALGASIVHKSRQAQARMLSGALGAEMPRDIFDLQKGECYVFTSTGEQWRVQIPLVDAQGVADLRKLVAAGGARPVSAVVSEAVSSGFRDSRNHPVLKAVPVLAEIGPKPEPKPGPDLVWWADATDHSPEYLRRMVRKLVGTDRLGLPAAIRQIDPKATGGDRYTKALAAATEIIREGLGGE